MLELIIALLKLTFENKKYTSNNYGLAQFVLKGDKRFPAGYQSKDNYQHITLEDSAIYFRQTGPETQTQDQDSGESGCDEMVTITYPLTAVAYVPKSIFGTDNAFIDNKVSRNIANLIENADYEQLRAAMKADDLRCVVRSVNVDRYDIWRREFSGVEMAARHDHVLCAVNFDIEIKINDSCLMNFECDDVAVEVVDGAIVVSIHDSTAWHIGGDAIGDDAEFGSTNNFGYYFIVNGVRYWLMNTSGHLIPQQPNSAIGSAAAPVTDGYFDTLHYNNLNPAIPAATLANVLIAGNTTGGRDIVLTTNDVIKSSAGGAQIDLSGSNVFLSTDNFIYATPYLYANQTQVTIAALGAGQMDFNLANINLVHGAQIDIDAPTLNAGVVNAVTANLATGAANTAVNIGTSGNNIITIGNTLSTINLIGTVINQNVVNLNVKDKLITLNDQGAAGSGSGVGFEVEENAIATGYFKTTGGRDGWLIKAPANNFDSSFLFAPTGANSYTFPDASGTVALVTDIPVYTWSTGLTDTADTITVNLSTGIAGGQSVIGGVAASENLTLSSTTHATKGAIVTDSRLSVVAGTLADQINALRVTGTLPDTPSNITGAIGLYIDITSAGNASQWQRGGRMQLLSGYTGSSPTVGMFFVNTVAGTGTDILLSTGGNYAASYDTSITTTGSNVGSYHRAELGNINVGSVNVSTTNKLGATNIGSFNIASQTSGTPIQIGSYSYLGTTVPAFTGHSAAAVANNGATTSPIQLWLDTSAIVGGVDNGGLAFFGATASTANTRMAITGAANAVALLVNEDGGTYYFKAEEVAGVKQIGFFNAATVVKQAALTAPETTVSGTAPGTPDYAFSSGVFGYSTLDEFRTSTQVIANLQTRVNELENRLQAYGLLN